MTKTALYRHYDADGALLYVGISGSVEDRDREHAVKSAWWGLVARTETEWCLSRPHARALEAVAISFEEPRFNVQKPGPATGVTTLSGFLRETGLTQSALARNLGVNQSYISRMCQGKKRPSLKVACAIADISDGRVPLSAWALFQDLSPPNAA